MSEMSALITSASGAITPHPYALCFLPSPPSNHCNFFLLQYTYRDTQWNVLKLHSCDMIYTMDFVKARNTCKTWKAKYFCIFFMVLFSDLLLTWVSHHQAHLKCSEDQVVSSNLCSPCLWQLWIERHMIRIIKLTFCECLLGKVMWEKNYSHPYFVGNEAQKVTKFDQTYTAGGGLTEGQCYSTHGLCVFSTIKRY